MDGILNWIVTTIGQVFMDLWEMIADFFIWIIESIGKFVIGILGGFGKIPGIDMFVNAFNALPPEMFVIFARFNLSACLGIIVAAVVLKLILQLIPFVRLGS